MPGHRFPDISIAVAKTDQAVRKPWPVGHDRYALARMVRAAPGRIAAMIGSQDQKVARLHLADHFGQALIKCFECGGIAGTSRRCP